MKNKIAALLALFVVTGSHAQQDTSFTFRNPALPVEQRVHDLVSRLTLEEKVLQMENAAPAIPRLGIPAYDWWNEILHGVARTPFPVTVFPQAIGMAATWDTTSLATMADYAALEGRAIHNKAISLGRENERYLGLTYWTPNINIFRDPRWGRGQETYGEDPFLTAMLGKAFVHGLQGDDPHYLKAAACAKHFAVHSGPEPSRHKDNIRPSSYDLWNTYLPAFRELVVNAKVAGVMCAYNAVDDQPCCGNDLLLTTILRNQWKFTGYVTSDCWALNDFFEFHKTHPDATAAAIDAVMHGTDVECGVDVYKTLLNAVKQGLVKEDQIDASLARLFTIRFRLGMFDPPALVKYAQTPASILESPGHKALAVKMAQQSIVLLRNEKSTLPLSKNIHSIAVIGPNADNRISILGNYNGTPSSLTTILDGIRQKTGDKVAITYEKGTDFTSDTLFVADPTLADWTTGDGNGVTARYYNSMDLSGSPALTTTEKNIDHNWQEGESPAQGVRSNYFSAEFLTDLHPRETGKLLFEVSGDDGYRIFVNDSLIIDAWSRNRWGARSFSIPVKQEQVYHLKVQYYQTEGSASIHLQTGAYVATDFQALAKRAAAADAIIFVGGISPQLEGEEMKVDLPGFHGGDRTSILLPAVQTRLVKILEATGKPVIFVMMSGSAVAIPWESSHIPAIMDAWYGGQAAGTAVADVLFGDYNPAGRLPVTFYKDDTDLPPFSDYSMQNRTYRYFKGQPLYPFGYGLSFTTFRYSNMQVGKKYEKGQPVTIEADIQNTGTRNGEEVVQLYISFPNADKQLIRELKGFQRIFLKSGERRHISFTLSSPELTLADNNGNPYQPTGTMTVSIGGGQPGQPVSASSNVLTKTTMIVP